MTTPEFVTECWCGAQLTERDLREMDADLEGPPCGGTGTLDCFCGGDFCCCHNHGSGECPGCDECRGDDGWDGDDYDPHDPDDWDELWPR